MAEDEDKLLPNHNADHDSKNIQVQDLFDDLEHSPDKGIGSSSEGINDSNSSAGGVENGRDEKKKTPMTLAQKLTFVGIAIAYMAVFTSFSVLAPFFPYEVSSLQQWRFLKFLVYSLNLILAQH